MIPSFPQGGRDWHVVDPSLGPEWDAALRNEGKHAIFQSTAWAKVLIDTYQHKPFYLVSNRGGPPSLWPLMEINSALTGRRGVSLPFTDECEPIFQSRGAADELLEAAIETGTNRGWRYLEFRCGKFPFPEAKASTTFYTHTLRLNRDIEGLLSACDSAVRRAIRKATQAGVRTEISRSWEAVRSFFELHCGTRRKHGLPPQPLSFFRNIHRHLLATDKGFVTTAFHNDRPIAVGIFFHTNGNAIYKFGASDERYQHLRGNNLMMWSAIRHFSALNCKSLHFGRTSFNNEGLRRYKLAWGVEERRLDYVRYDLKKRAFVTSDDRASGWHNQVFRRLPTVISRGIGLALYRHMS